MDVFELDRLTCGRDDPTNNQNIDADLDGGGNQTTTLFVDIGRRDGSLMRCPNR